MKIIYLLLISSCFSMLLSAQSWDNAGCGTAPNKSDWLKAYQKNPTAFQRNNSTTLYAKLSLHVVGDDDGNGYVDRKILLENICQVNEDFESTGIQFILEDEINYINNTEWWEHNDLIKGVEMMEMNNVPNSVNIYIVRTAAGTAGYNLPHADGCVIRTLSIGVKSHVMSHEIGHNLSIQHPFLGWEGGVGINGGTSHNYNNPAPTTVIYDYTEFQQDAYYNPADTTIIDTAYVELMDGSNCTFAADGFCDTPPDYLYIPWDCDIDSMSITEQTDPNGVKFYSDGRNIMSYASDNCNAFFTNEQGLAMQANLMDQKPGHIDNQSPLAGPIDGPTNLLTPMNNESIDGSNVTLTWNATPGATQYFLQINRFNSFVSTFMYEEVFVQDTFYNVTATLPLDEFVSWRIKPLNQSNFCTNYTSASRFIPTNPLAVEEVSFLNHFALVPNFISSNQSIQIQVESERTTAAKLVLYNLAGQKIMEETSTIALGNQILDLQANGLVAGMYIVGMETEEGNVYRKLMVR